ncbi:alpha/beta hydrolase [Variovorax sp. M-6]|uniref:alpha/beta hydrolase n=1 Tax=Variovorax sp. M-6 TaxID=3233041 RepID=UPI003F973042
MVLMSTTLRIDGWGASRWRFLLPLALHTPLGHFWSYRERPPFGVKNERVRTWVERDMRTRRISSAGSSVIGIEHLRQHDRLIRHVRARLDLVTCREVLALHARDDEVASIGNLGLLARGLRHTALRAVVLGNSYHMITIDNDREQVVREVVAFAAAPTQGRA